MVPSKGRIYYFLCPQNGTTGRRRANGLNAHEREITVFDKTRDRRYRRNWRFEVRLPRNDRVSLAAQIIGLTDFAH